jgi:biopolymer transport protein ExbD
MRFPRRRRPAPTTDLTPLIDVVFLLLIFFAVSTSFVTAQGIQVDLPRSRTRDTVDQDNSLRVTVRQEGQLYLDDRPVNLDGLRAAFERAASGDVPPVVVIRADQAVAHGLVVQVMDLAQRSGLRRLSVATEPQSR